MLDSRPKGRGFEPHRRHYVVSLSKNINPSLVLVQPRKDRPFITERLLMGRTNKQILMSHFRVDTDRKTLLQEVKNLTDSKYIPLAKYKDCYPN